MDTPLKKYQELFINILDIIEYTGDKEAFINKLMNNIFVQAFIDLIQTLPEIRQEKIKKELFEIKSDPEEIESVMNKYFREEERTQAVQLVTKNAMVEYFKEIDASLSPTQRQRLVKLLEEFNSTIGQV